MVRHIITVFFMAASLVQAQELSMMDSMRSKFLTSAISIYFSAQGYGTVENVTVDTTKKTMHFVLFPQGETQKLSIAIGHYQTEVIEKKDYLILQKVETNRIWLNRIFADHMSEGIKVPLGIASKGAGTLLLSI